MEKRVKVSIIMPVYKVEEYVAKAIESVQAQTLTDWELFAVDDGSPDRSGAICEEYAAKDPRIIVLHKENGGAPSARNMAIEQAHGEYMMFMDSDDWMEIDALEDMYDIAKRDGAQLVVTGFYIDTYIGGNKYMTDVYNVEDATYSCKKDFRKNAYKLFDKNQLYSPWNKLFKSQYILDNNLRFKPTFWDDFPFILDTIKDIERVSVTSKCYYHFLRARTESETASYRPGMYEKREEEHEWMMNLYRGWHIGDPRSVEMIARRYVDRFVGCIENVTNPKCELKKSEKKKQIKDMLYNKRIDRMLTKARPKSFYMKIMLIPIRHKWVNLTYLEAKVISFVKTKNTKLFTKLKVGR